MMTCCESLTLRSEEVGRALTHQDLRPHDVRPMFWCIYLPYSEIGLEKRKVARKREITGIEAW